MYCLDTSIIVEILRGNKKFTDKLNSYIADEVVFATSISFCELCKGAYGHSNAGDKLDAVKSFFREVEFLTLSKESSLDFGELWQSLKKKGKMIGDFDILIASIVKSENMTLITRDKHFRNLGIKVVVI